MNRDILFLLQPDFMDDGAGPYFCPGCAEVTGFLTYYPAVKQHLEVRSIAFPRPRPELVPLLGEENQGCPVLVLHQTPSNLPSHLTVRQANGHAFVEGPRDIAAYLAHVHGTGIPH